MATTRLLFEDYFNVLDKDPDGKKFDKVSRLKCRSEYYEMELLLDVNTSIYPVEVGDKFSLALSSTLRLDGAPDERVYDQSGNPSLADKYEYVMYGKLFKYQDDGTSGAPKVEVYISFGGLLMMLKGDPRNLHELELDQNLYLLMRKI
eukprot:jgi/Mesvir1/23584/Mv18275-RA.1